MTGRKIFWLIFIAIAVRAAFYFSVVFPQAPLLDDDTDAVVNMLEGDRLHWHLANSDYYAAKPPGFTGLCFITYKLFGFHPNIILLLQFILAGFVPCLAYLIAKRLIDERWAVVAAVLTAIHPPLVVYSAMRLADFNFYVPLYLWSFYCLIRLYEDGSVKNALFAGVVFGCALLFRSIIMLFFLLAAVWFILHRADGRLQRTKLTVLVMAVSACILAPWWIRNYNLFHRPVLFQTDKWFAFWAGNVPGSTGSLYVGNDVSVWGKHRDGFGEQFFKLDEIEQGEIFRQKTIGYFYDDRAGFLLRIVKKVFYFWYFSPHQGQDYPLMWMMIYKIYYLCIILPAVYFIVFLLCSVKRRDFLPVLFYLFFLSFTAVHAAYFTEGRHRFCIAPVLLICTAGGLGMMSVRGRLKNIL